VSTSLSVSSLSLRLGAFRMADISLSLDKGEYLVLMGPSGCGKTSLLRAIAGLVASKGSIEVEGRDISTSDPSRRGVGYVPQMAALFPHLTVRDNIGFGLRYVGLSGAAADVRVREVAHKLGVVHLLERRPGTLSGGEAKRVALARCMAPDPRVLLLDEPLGMLDPISRRELILTLRALTSEFSASVLHVTHDCEEAWTLGNSCAVMSRGAIEQRGRAEDIRFRPASKFVATFFSDADLLPATAAGDSLADVGFAVFPCEGAVPPGCSVAVLPEYFAPGRGDGLATFSAQVLSVVEREGVLRVEISPRKGLVLRAQAALSDAPLLTPGKSVSWRLVRKGVALPDEAAAEV